jgi:isoleucyl-tRNA synthetase
MGFKILSDSYVKSNNGTGIVHLAPLFGDDDLRVLNNNGYNILWLPDIVDTFVKIKNDLIINNENVKGMFIMDITNSVIYELKVNKILFKTEKIKHTYPFCWRTDKPLIYLAVDAWFLNI